MRQIRYFSIVKLMNSFNDASSEDDRTLPTIELSRRSVKHARPELGS